MNMNFKLKVSVETLSMRMRSMRRKGVESKV